jgi:hypothetical protein
MTAGPPEVPDHVFGACLLALNSLECDGARAALVAGLFGRFLAGVPWQAERAYSEAITRLAVEAAAVARNAEQAE